MQIFVQNLVLSFACLLVLACSSSTRKNEQTNVSSSQNNSASRLASKPEAVALKIPERIADGSLTEEKGGWNELVQKITYQSSADNSQQPAMFYAPKTDEPRPLLVGLHSWSSDYTQESSAIYAEWAIANDWVFIHPNFRGSNESPETTGSELVIKDVVSAVEYAKQNAKVDTNRIYAIGYSGGGHLGLLLAGREPKIWAGVSVWVPISDLTAWYRESEQLGTKYAKEIAASCGGNPLENQAAAEDCRQRSGIAHLENARNVLIDIHHGIRDGHGEDPVPVSQSLRAFNILAESADRFTVEKIEFITKNQAIPPQLKSETSNTADSEKVLLRRESSNVRLTIFDGGHDKITEASIKWLNRQRKSG